MTLRDPLMILPAAGCVRRSGICLNMIVRDEAPVLHRLFASVRDAIDYFVIVDTGSTDATPELIGELARSHGLGGEVHFRDWVNFGHNRQQALELAVASGRADWLLFIDADEELAHGDPAWWTRLEPGTSYQLEKHHDWLRYALNNLVWVRDLAWRWHGVVHEYVAADREHPLRRLSDAWIIYHAGEGGRSRGVTPREKFLRDAALLEAELRHDPLHPRNRFYLAQSYRDAGELARAHRHYGLRVELQGWVEETYIAQCERARLAIELRHGHASIVAEHLKAFAIRPCRAEALWQLAAYCRRNERHAEGYVFAKAGKDIPLPADTLFLRPEVYAWQILDEFSVCAYWIGQYQESADACRGLLAGGWLPPDHVERIRANLDFALARL